MQVTVDIPDTLAAHLLAAGEDPARIALNALALEALRELDIATEVDIHEAIRQGRADVAAAPNLPSRRSLCQVANEIGHTGLRFHTEPTSTESTGTSVQPTQTPPSLGSWG